MAGASARAFVPGHVTLFFSPRWHDDPGRAGSTGGGIALSHGVEVEVEPADSTAVFLDGEERPVVPVEAVLDALSATASVRIETLLPVGAGFGVSGAAALGTALAANEALGGGRSENDLAAVAHRAEVEAGTGLGDVVAQARGGVPLRFEPGAPPHAALDGIPTTARVEYVSFGEVGTAGVLESDTGRIEAAGAAALDRVREEPTLGALFEAGRRFAREADLLTPRVREAVAAVESAGGEAAMAMLGETVVALGSGLSDAGYDPETCRVHPGGATLRE